MSLLACDVHWFNPIVWISRQEISRAFELSCDEAVFSSMDNRAKQNYGETLICSTANSKTPLAVLSTTRMFLLDITPKLLLCTGWHSIEFCSLHINETTLVLSSKEIKKELSFSQRIRMNSSVVPSFKVAFILPICLLPSYEITPFQKHIQIRGHKFPKWHEKHSNID